MNAGMKNGINLLMILVLFISCVQEKEDNNVLRRVDNFTSDGQYLEVPHVTSGGSRRRE